TSQKAPRSRQEWHPHRFPLRSEVQDQLAKAVRDGFRMAPCAVCGGPEIFSQLDPTRSRCLRCGTVRISDVANPQTSWRRCACCGKQTMTGQPMRLRFCADCAKLSPKQRRWRQTRESTPKNINEIAGARALPEAG